jgi:hypothetical protein
MHPYMLDHLTRERMLDRRRAAETDALVRQHRPRRGWLTNLFAGLARHAPHIRPQPARPLERAPRTTRRAITGQAH